MEWSISLQPQEELAAFARFGNAVASLCVEKKGARACLKNHFRNLQAPLCGIFYPHSVAVARYAALIRIKSPTNWDSQFTKWLPGPVWIRRRMKYISFRSGKMASVSSRSKDQIKKKWNSASICNDSKPCEMEEKSRIMLAWISVWPAKPLPESKIFARQRLFYLLWNKYYRIVKKAQIIPIE